MWCGACGSFVLCLDMSLYLRSFTLKENFGVDKIIVKKQPYQLLNANHEFFQVLMPSTFINWLMNLRKLGRVSSLFCIL